MGRKTAGGEAIALLSIDHPVPEDAIKALEATGMFGQVENLEFDVA